MTVKLVKIDKNNYDDAIDLKTSKEHEQFVASNEYSIAQAQYLPGINCYGIYDDDLMVGFTMYGIREEFDEDDDEQDKRFYIWRFMIANNQRCKGYAKKALQLIIDEAVSLDQSVIALDTGTKNIKARALYESAGFKATGEEDYVLILKDETTPENNKSTEEIKTKPEIISLSTDESEQFCGFYRSDKGSLIRKIYLKDGDLYYWRNEESESKLSPVSKTELCMGKFAHVLLKLNIINDTKIIDFFENETCKVKLINYLPETLSTTDLERYTGDYYCKELGLTYQLKMDSDKLIFMVKNRFVSQIQAINRDLLLNVEWECFFSFICNEHKEITGLISNEKRTENFEFVKM